MRAAAEMVLRVVTRSFSVDRDSLVSGTRGIKAVAQARQAGMYLLHIVFGLTYEEVGLAFGRERTTVAHACAKVEDERDDLLTDMKLETLEDALERLWAIERLRNGGRCGISRSQAAA
jgi:chromosomal replication initiation ATPase DnaA